jgi:hypothetical protein
VFVVLHSSVLQLLVVFVGGVKCDLSLFSQRQERKLSPIIMMRNSELQTCGVYNHSTVQYGSSSFREIRAQGKRLPKGGERLGT